MILDQFLNLQGTCIQGYRHLENSLVNTSETIDILADDTERLKDSASPFLKTRVEKTIDAVKQTLQESDRAWQELNQ